MLELPACSQFVPLLLPIRRTLALHILRRANKLARYLQSLINRVRRRIPDSVSKATSSFDWPTKQGGRSDRPTQKMEMPDAKSERPEKSYLSAAVDSMSPWGGSRSSTPKPASITGSGEASGLKNQHGGDATTQHWHGIRSKDYPVDCKLERSTAKEKMALVLAAGKARTKQVIHYKYQADDSKVLH